MADLGAMVVTGLGKWGINFDLCNSGVTLCFYLQYMYCKKVLVHIVGKICSSDSIGECWFDAVISCCHLLLSFTFDR